MPDGFATALEHGHWLLHVEECPIILRNADSRNMAKFRGLGPALPQPQLICNILQLNPEYAVLKITVVNANPTPMRSAL